MLAVVNDSFATWLIEELKKKDWSQSDLARRAGVSQVTVSRVLSETRQPGPEFCQGVAQALRIPPEQVFRRAGLLPLKSQQQEGIEELLFYYEQLTPGDQARALTLLRALAEERVEYDAEASPRLQGKTATA